LSKLSFVIFFMTYFKLSKLCHKDNEIQTWKQINSNVILKRFKITCEHIGLAREYMFLTRKCEF
jgi:hypothetical protein